MPFEFGDMAFFLGGPTARHQGPRVGQVAETWRTGGFSTTACGFSMPQKDDFPSYEPLHSITNLHYRRVQCTAKYLI